MRQKLQYWNSHKLIKHGGKHALFCVEIKLRKVAAELLKIKRTFCLEN